MGTERSALPTRDRRGVSTVVDVSLALLLITASIALVFGQLRETETPPEPKVSGEMAQTLSATTLTVTYDVSHVVDELDHSYDGYPTVRTTHGTVVQLLADGAVADVSLGDRADGFVPVGKRFTSSLTRSTRSLLVGTHYETQVVALWRPYPGSRMTGKVVAGARPPPRADTSVLTMSVPSGIPDVEDAAVERRYRTEGLDGVSRLVSRAVVRGYFPPKNTQVAVESAGLEMGLVKQRYENLCERLGCSVGDFTRWGFNVTEANADLARALHREFVRADIRNAFADEMAALDEEYSNPRARERAAARLVANRVSTGKVTLIVRVWNTDE